MECSDLDVLITVFGIFGLIFIIGNIKIKKDSYKSLREQLSERYYELERLKQLQDSESYLENQIKKRNNDFIKSRN